MAAGSDLTLAAAALPLLAGAGAGAFLGGEADGDEEAPSSEDGKAREAPGGAT